MKVAYMTLLVLLVAGCTFPVWGDVVVFRTGGCEEVKITDVARDALTVAGPYGEITYPYGSIYWFCPSSDEYPGLEYYWAGVRLLELHKLHPASAMFAKAGAINEQYREAGRQALRKYQEIGSSHDVPDGREAYTIPCKLCGGTGKLDCDLPKIAMTDMPHPYIIEAA
ncbi:MAG: hypothetical protein JW889_08905 [Verrucomicrobia bacterium]|nr:hypothetical protein [Verrucomicrobiota bacterium]